MTADAPLIPNDIDHLDPGIAQLVLDLRAQGIRTTDSGDGMSKLPGGYWERRGFQAYDAPDVIPWPHVVFRSSVENLGKAMFVFCVVTNNEEGWSFLPSIISDDADGYEMLVMAIYEGSETKRLGEQINDGEIQ